MADPQTSSSSPSDSLPTSLINPNDMSYFNQPGAGTAAPKLTPVSFNPNATASTPPPAPAPSPAPQPAVQPAARPVAAPAVSPPTPLVSPLSTPPQPAAPSAPSQTGAAAPAATPTYTAVGDSIAAGIAGSQHFHQTYEGRDLPEAKANPGIMAASGRTTGQTLSVISANPQQFAGKDVILSTGMSNDLNGGIPLDTAMTNVASQLDALRKAGARVTLVGVGAGVKDAAAANAKLAQIAQAYGTPFTGELAETQATGNRPASVHPANNNYGAIFGQIHPQQPSTPGTGKTIDDATAYIQQREGGGPFILYGHEGQPYDPNSMPTRAGYYGFPDWAGGYGPDGRQTHAAGGAQWEPDTWKKAVEGFTQAGLGNQLGHTPDFRNPADQKAVFNYWAARRYREQTGRDIVADMNAGHVDWSALGSEWSSLKYAGSGGIAGMTASNLPSYQEYAALSQQQRDLLQQEIAAGQKAIAGMEAGDPKQRALADQLMQKQLQLMDKYEDMIAHPPTQKPHDMIANFGSIATLVGILAGRFAHRPMVASLSAAGAAMQAMNDNDYEAYQNSFNQWKTQANMTQTLLGMESSAYKNVMEDKRLDMDEKFKMLDEQMRVFQNAQGIIASERGDFDKQWEIAEKTQELSDRHDAHVKQIVEANEKQEQDTAIRNAAAEDDRAWLKDHPEANGIVPDSVHFDNLARRRGEISEAGKAPTVGLEKEREVAKAVEADDQAWLAQHPDVKTVPADVHFKHYTDRETQISQTTPSGIRAANNPQALALQKFLEEHQGATSQEIQDFIMRMHPGRSGPAMAVSKFIEENPNASSADIANYYANLMATVSSERNWSTGPLGNAVRSFSVSIDHLATMTDLADAMQNTGVRFVNAMKNRIQTEFGNTAQPNFETAKSIVGAEVNKAIEGGAVALTDREELRNSFTAASTPEQLLGVIQTLKKLMAGQLNGYRRQYMASTGRDDFDERFLSADAKRELEGLGGSSRAGGASTAKPAWADPRYTDPPLENSGRSIWPKADGKWYFGDDGSLVPGQQ